MKKQDLIGLLNELYIDRRRSFGVYYAKTLLFYAKLDEGVTLRAFNPELEGGERPGFDDLLLALRAAGLLKWKNYDDVHDKLELEIKRNKDKVSSAISYDTCFLRSRGNRIIHHLIFSLLKGSKTYFPMPMADGVRKELRYIDYKYKQEQLLKEKLPGQWVGQPDKETRKIRLGNIEHKRISRSPYYINLDSDEGDMEIIRALGRYRKSEGKDVLVFTEDNNFAEMASDEGLRSILVEHQQKVPSTLQCTWEEFADLLYVIAIIFGWLKLDKKPIYGIWAGKKGYHWEGEEVGL